MKNSELLSADFIMDRSLNDESLKEIADELEKGVDAGEDEITEFKVEQRITGMDTSSEFGFGAFVNANSRIKSLNTSYMAMLMSNTYRILNHPDGTRIIRRLGLGFELMLSVKDVETKINANYGVVSASGALGLAKVMYKISVYGVLTPELLQYLPKQEGHFTSKVFEEIQFFFTKAKEYIGDMDKSKLYPIEIIENRQITPDKANTKAIYYGVRAVAAGKKLIDCINESQQKKLKLDENVIQFIYNYFDLGNAYAIPSSVQKQNAANWISSQYNKMEEPTTGGTWVEIDQAYATTIDPASKYKPHPVPSNWASVPKVVREERFEVSANYSADLKIGAMVNASTRFNTYALGKTIGFFLETFDNAAPDSKVLETRYGVGVRVTVKASDVEFGTSVNFASIGAMAELDLGNVEYEISGVGINDSELVKMLPVPQDINQKTFAGIHQTIEALKIKIAKLDPSKFKPQALAIRVKEPENADPTLYAQAAVLAYRYVAERERLTEAIAKAKSLRLPEEAVKQVYADLKIENNDRPKGEHERKAEDWLEFGK